MPVSPVLILPRPHFSVTHNPSSLHWPDIAVFLNPPRKVRNQLNTRPHTLTHTCTHTRARTLTHTGKPHFRDSMDQFLGALSQKSPVSSSDPCRLYGGGVTDMREVFPHISFTVLAYSLPSFCCCSPAHITAHHTSLATFHFHLSRRHTFLDILSETLHHIFQSYFITSFSHTLSHLPDTHHFIFQSQHTSTPLCQLFQTPTRPPSCIMLTSRPSPET